jgi:hypothetical protein
MSFINVVSINMFTQSMINDRASIVLCRRNLSELENILEKLALSLNDTSRRPYSDVSKIEKVKQILKRLDVNQAELFIKNSQLEKLINHSLEYILSHKKNPNDPQNYIPFIGVMLCKLWGKDSGRNYEAMEIKAIRSLLDACLIKRLWKRFDPISNIIKIVRYSFSFIKFPSKS